MKKLIAIVAAVAVVGVAGLYVGTKLKENNAEEETTTEIVEQTVEGYSEKEENSKATTEATTEEATTEKQTESEDVITFDELLDEIKNFPYGTAGSTQKAIKIATDFINLVKNNVFDKEKIEEAFNEFKENLSEEKIQEFLDNLYSIDEYVKKIFNGTDSSDAEDYDAQTDDGKFSLEDYQQYFDILSEV